MRRNRFFRYRFFKTASAAIAVLTGFGDAGNAQFTPAANVASTVMTVSGFSCKTAAGTGAFLVSSWNWGDEAPTISLTPIPGGSGKVVFDDFQILKNFDACSTALAAVGASSGHIPQITVQEFDKNNTLLITIVLTTVLVAGDQVDGTVTNAAPLDAVTFVFGTAKITNNITNMTKCWNVETNSAVC